MARSAAPVGARRVLSVRIHLDDCEENDGPLRVVVYRVTDEVIDFLQARYHY